MRSELALLGICLSALGCAKPPPGGSRPGEARDALADPGRVASGPQPTGVVPLPSASWTQAIREYRWSDAARLLDALGEPEKRRADVRYARARVAHQLGKHADACGLLEGLEQSLPLLRDDIARMRAESELVAGPFIAAGEYFSSRADADSLVKAALAFEKARQYKRARLVLDQALTRFDQQTRGRSRLRGQARARAVRARVAEKRRHIALAAADLRWLATEAATEPDAQGADQTLERLAPAHKLGARERVERAMQMAGRGWVARTDQELRLAAKASGARPTEAETCRAQGLARSVARMDCKRAGELLERAAQLDGSRRMRDLLEAARAWSRTDDEARALKIYADIARRAPRTGWADHASYYSARLHLVRASYGEAASAFSRYLELYGIRAAHAKAATYFRAVAWLATGEYSKAAGALDRLTGEERKAHLKARYQELYGVALQGLKQDEDARATFRRVLRESPLSFPALLAAARLREAGEAGVQHQLPVLSVQPALVLQLPPKVALLKGLGLDTEAEAALMDEEAGLREAHGTRAVEALCTAYSELSPATRRYRVGSRALRSPDLATAPEPWARWLWECNYPRPYPTLVAPVEDEFKLPHDLIYAVMRQESAFSPNAASPAQAVGLLQIIPPTAERIAAALHMGLARTDCENPAHAIRMGGYYLRQVLDTFGGNLVLATAAYNAGPVAVSRWLESGEQLPLDVFAARIPFDETRGYVAHVLGNYARYAYLAGGAEALPELSLKITPGLRAAPDAY
ncbi:MAG: transglycosylase SLT domain-containing protein [Polyangiaceae bacterium]|nr:transglycosylase SLT domain-containing protein [Polyangiaceae bacterium]